LPILRLLINPSCPLKVLYGKGQKEADDLQFKASQCNGVDLLRTSCLSVAVGEEPSGEECKEELEFVPVPL
jgi:hypothetical protein